MRGSGYGDLRFDAECLSARRRGGGLVRFSRNERALLLRFMQAPRCLLTRTQLLAALDPEGETSERNVDYIVNRLRAKLGDDARHPRFIRTQYGEGYVWIAEPAEASDAAPFIAIGPTDGDAADTPANRFLHRLRDALAGGVAPFQEIALLDGSPAHVASAAAFAISAGLYLEGDRLRGVLVLRDGPTLRMIAAERVDAAPGDPAPLISALARRLLDAMREELVEGAPGGARGPSTEPRYVRTIAAERKFSGMPVAPADADGAFVVPVAADDEARQRLERASACMARMMYALGADGTMDPDTRQAAEDAIEADLLAALPRLQHDPGAMLSAAKLLLRLGPGHRQLAADIVDAVLERDIAVVGALSLRAQLRMYDGLIDEAVVLYERCLAHAAPGSEYRAYLLVLKTYALLALGNHAAAAEICTELHEAYPETRVQMHPAFHTLPHGCIAHAAADMDATRMRERIAHAWFMVARHFREPRHRAGFMHCILANALAAHGTGCIPDELMDCLPLPREPAIAT